MPAYNSAPDPVELDRAHAETVIQPRPRLPNALPAWVRPSAAPQDWTGQSAPQAFRAPAPAPAPPPAPPVAPNTYPSYPSYPSQDFSARYAAMLGPPRRVLAQDPTVVIPRTLARRARQAAFELGSIPIVAWIMLALFAALVSFRFAPALLEHFEAAPAVLEAQ
ncbi:hypothetical protein AKJ09_08898 [Labilithrix luteola]|uniref:Uncharacterized protein n=1 Tax=Labilithrix luteola TaxID=1391654 RepID=A0A0K1QA14_9BACT|nr:hypothetical protein [Labilithrix luteola]AKV02235.1 hypothetical protein AKJ09_08898 [Labilithrix luteola]